MLDPRSAVSRVSMKGSHKAQHGAVTLISKRMETLEYLIQSVDNGASGDGRPSVDTTTYCKRVRACIIYTQTGELGRCDDFPALCAAHSFRGCQRCISFPDGLELFHLHQHEASEGVASLTDTFEDAFNRRVRA